MIEGVKVSLAGTVYEVPPLSLKALRRLMPKIAELSRLGQRLPTEEELSAVVELCHAALVRNYPEMTVAQLEEMMDMQNMYALLGAVMGASGLERREGASPGAGSP